ncbi:uncharacterized protein BX663DRAFT_453015 [Cokeromyces recurvatus]|uniref:uncharacterized protein n=1 Tax=Cokeromyces recurvatus TaxID=90255 RepID=UPI00221E6285|nr:uncharacterized protein BX663DRAFT_453015 [Cokeromyces recurvatus]KAI7903497.1 hypothetical protein BX663DRAFT_453015 [Cokeromyces recurvatus]
MSESSSLDLIKHFLLESRLNTDRNLSLKLALDIIEILVSSRCCLRCCFRHLGCITFQIYAFDQKELYNTLNQLLQTDRQRQLEDVNNLVCTACLGSIQFAESYVDKVHERLKKEDYKVNSCNLSCTLPISILHRDHLLKAHVLNVLMQKYADQDYTATLASIYKNMDVRDPKDFFKYLFGLKLKERTGLQLETNASLRMTVVVDHESTCKEHMFLTQLKEPLLNIRTIRQKRMRVTIGDSRSNITEALKRLNNNEAKEVTAIPPIPVSEKAQLNSVELIHASTYVGGRYLKYSREYSQTPWAIKGQKLAEHSVSGCIVDIIRKYHRADDTKFVSAGREDANVRMLGTGRPFYVELINPRTPKLSKEMYKKIENEINNQEIHKDHVQVRHLTYIKPEYTNIIKEGEETKTKKYRALVWLSEPLTDELIERINKIGSTPFTIQQKTPVRVFQRRAAAIRPKVIHTSTISRVHPNVDLNSPEARFGVLKLHTQAGTYIKEYVHGDLGRTLPNLASVGQIHSADLLELDVMDVDLIWPPVTEEEEGVINEDIDVNEQTNKNNKRTLL